MVTKTWLILLAAMFAVAGCGTGAVSNTGTGVGTAAQPVSQIAQTQQTQQTQFGPMNASDRDLIVKVRLAGLWEMPAGQQAEERASSNRVKEVGQLIMNEHATLDKITRDTAAQLSVELPNQPNKDQQGWLAEMNNARGAQWDQIFANRLRAAHGGVFPVIAQVRAGTRNSVVRKFAETANEFVMRHMGYLESTGLVDHTALPEAPAPGATAPAPAQQRNVVGAAASSPSGGSASAMGAVDMLVVLLLSVMAVVITLGLLWVIRSPERARSLGKRRAAPDPAGDLFAEKPRLSD